MKTLIDCLIEQTYKQEFAKGSDCLRSKGVAINAVMTLGFDVWAAKKLVTDYLANKSN